MRQDSGEGLDLLRREIERLEPRLRAALIDPRRQRRSSRVLWVVSAAALLLATWALYGWRPAPAEVRVLSMRVRGAACAVRVLADEKQQMVLVIPAHEAKSGEPIAVIGGLR